MKQLVLLTLELLGVAGAARGQALRGGYTRSYFIGRTSYWFSSGHFRAIRRGCTGYNVAGGTYRVVGYQLRLHYLTDVWLAPESSPAEPNSVPLVPSRTVKRDSTGNALVEEFAVPIYTADVDRLVSPPHRATLRWHRVAAHRLWLSGEYYQLMTSVEVSYFQREYRRLLARR